MIRRPGCDAVFSCLFVVALLFPAGAGAGVIEGVVRVLESGEPVAGVAVWVSEVSTRIEVGATDSEGRYRFEDLPAGRYRVRVRPDGRQAIIGAWNGGQYSYCQTETVVVPHKGEAVPVDFDLPTGGRIAGRILDARSGLGLGGATISVRGLDIINSNATFAVNSAADGSFEVLGLDSFVDAPGSYRIEVRVSGYPTQWYPGGVYGAADSQIIEVWRSDDLNGLVINMDPGDSVEGRISSAGQAVVGATVQARHLELGSAASSSTAADGSFRLDGLPPGGVNVIASAAGLERSWYPGVAARPQTAQVQVVAGVGATGVDWELRDEGRVQVIVRGGGEPVAGITVVGQVDGFELVAVGVTDENGSVSLGNMPTGDWSVQAWPSPLSGWLLSEIYPLGPWTSGDSIGPIDVWLDPEASVSGQVLRLGGPLYGAKAFVMDEDENERSATTDRDGLFELGGLAPGDYRVRIEGPSFCDDDPGWVPVYAPAGRTPGAGALLEMGAGHLDLDPVLLPPDMDRDAMDDVWELVWGLDSAVDDSAEDPDADGLSNLDEYRRHTDPWDGLAASCSQLGKRPVTALLFVLLVFVVAGRRHGRVL